MPSRKHVLMTLACGLTAMALAACSPSTDTPSGQGVELVARAVLPADTFMPDTPPVGVALEPVINGRELPFGGVPVQGFSSLVTRDDNQFVALQDNGFGTMANSPDYPLGWFHLHIDLAADNPVVEVLDYVTWADPEGRIPFALTLGDSIGRPLTGADFDPESFVRMSDGSYWVGDEFGPSLVHVGPDGVILEKPVPIPVVPPLRLYSRGSPILRTPDHPDLRFLRGEEMRLDLANLPRSGGLEGLARNSSGSLLYASVEKPLSDDPVRTRRTILEFDPVRHGFTGNFWLYEADDEGISLASLEAINDHVFLVLERDGGEGETAQIKRIYRIDLNEFDEGGFLKKTLVCDLMMIDDPNGITQAEEGALGLGPVFTFPFVTPECLAIIDDRTLLVANDNNYPMSVGRRPPGTPDDNEFILIRLPASLAAGD